MFIVACAALSSMHSYRSAEREMVADMSQALMQTLAEKSEMTITPDTILTYRSHLRIMALREKSIVYYAMNGDEGMLSTRPMRWKNQHSTADFQAFAHCSVASVLAFSDQRLPLSFGRGLVVGDFLHRLFQTSSQGDDSLRSSDVFRS